MKRKKDYSLTAKERKALRQAEFLKSEKKKPDADINAEEQTVAPAEELQQDTSEVNDGVAQVKAPVSRKPLWVAIICAVLAVAIILTGILVAVLPRGDKNSSKYPRAKITLDDGRTLELIIWEDDCPIAATNFIFLAKIGFFNGTIIYDLQKNNNYMRFGDHLTIDDTRYKDTAFESSVSKSIFNIDLLQNSTYKNRAENYKFGYKLKADTGGDARRYGTKYVVSYNRENTADFVINMLDGNTKFASNGNSTDITSNLVAFAEFSEQSWDIIDDIFYNAETINQTGYPTIIEPKKPGTDNNYKITKVVVDNLQSSKWKNFEFISYMKTAYNGNDAIETWRAS